MGYFDDFQLLNVTDIRMYGPCETQKINTPCHYIGIMRGTYICNDQIEQRPMVYLTPGGIETISGWQSPAGKYRDNFYIECSGSRADRFMTEYGTEGTSKFIFISDPVPFISKLQELKRLFTTGNPLHNCRMTLCFEEFAALLENELRSNHTPAINRYHLEELLSDINRNPEKRWDFNKYAANSGITLRHWNRLFTAVTGMPPHRFVNSCRIKMARELLTSTELSIKEISVKCGFENASEFSRFFKNNTAVTPGECRKSRLR